MSQLRYTLLFPVSSDFRVSVSSPPLYSEGRTKTARGIVLIFMRDNRGRVLFGLEGILKVFLMTEGAASFVSVNAAVSD